MTDEERQHEEDLQRIRGFRLIDDDFMNACLMDNDVFGDEEHIIYVNGASEDGETELGKLMHDFKCTEPDEMFFKELAEKPRYFKKTVEGVSSMCKVLEDMRNQTAWNTKVESVKRGLANSFSYEQIALIVGLTVDQVKEIAGEKSA